MERKTTPANPVTRYEKIPMKNHRKSNFFARYPYKIKKSCHTGFWSRFHLGKDWLLRKSGPLALAQEYNDYTHERPLIFTINCRTVKNIVYNSKLHSSSATRSAAVSLIFCSKCKFQPFSTAQFNILAIHIIKIPFPAILLTSIRTFILSILDCAYLIKVGLSSSYAIWTRCEIVVCESSCEWSVLAFRVWIVARSEVVNYKREI